MTVVYEHTYSTSGKAARQREAEDAAMRRQPRMFWDPNYYADPRNANMARSIVAPDGPGQPHRMMTEAQFNRAHIAAQASMYGERAHMALLDVLSGSPTITPGAAVGLATIMRNMQLPQAVIDDVLTLDAEVRATDPNTAGRRPERGSEAEKGWLSRTIGGISRPAFALASMPFEAVIGGIRSIVADITTRDPRYDLSFDLGRKAETETGALEQTLGGQYIEGLLSPDVTADLGEGYIPRGDVHERQVQATRNAAPLVFNHAWTIGRGVGSLFFEDGESLAYRNLSGVIDLTANIVLDPFVLVGKANATARLLRQDIAAQARRDIGESTEKLLHEREAIDIAMSAADLARRSEVVSRATLDVANATVHDASLLAAQAGRTQMATGDAQRIGELNIRLDQVADRQDLLAAELSRPAAREAQRLAARRELLRSTDQITESERATALGELEAAATRGGPGPSVEADVLDTIDELERSLGPDGLDAMTAKIVADAPELPGVFTDAVPMVSRSRSLPGAENGRDAVVRFNQELGPRVLPSVDDWVDDPAAITASLKRHMRGKSNDRTRAMQKIIDRLADPDVTYTDILTLALTHNVGAPVLIALRESDVEGVTDIFRLTGGEGGVWWTTPEIDVAHWTPEGWRMRDTTPTGLAEQQRALAIERADLETQRKAQNKINAQARQYGDRLAARHVQVANQHTAVADSYQAVRAAVEMGLGVRRSLGKRPELSYDMLRAALFDPHNDFDAMIGATAQLPGWVRAAETGNRVMMGVVTLGGSEVVRAARALGVQPFIARSRQRLLDELVAVDDGPEALGRLQRLTNGKLDPELMRALVRAKTEEQVLEVLGPSLGVDITRPIGPGLLQAQRLRLNSVNGGRANDALFGKAQERIVEWAERMGAVAPRMGAVINFTDPQGSAQVLRNYLTTVPAIRVETVDKIIGEYLFAPGEVGRGTVLRRAMDTVADELVAHNQRLYGLDSEITGKLNDAVRHATQIYEGGRYKANDWWLQKYAADAKIGYTTIDGQLIHLTGPQLEAELARGGAVMPDMTALRDGIGRWGKAMQQHEWLRKSLDVLDYAMDYWRSAVLFRFAYTVRNIGEMQFRMFLTGHSSVFNDPLGSLAMASALNKKNRTSRGFFAQVARYDKTATGKELGPVDDAMLDSYEEQLREFVDLMSRTSSHHDMRTMRAMEAHHDVKEVAVDQPYFARGWAEELIKLHHSPLARLAAGWNPKGIQAQLKRGVGRETAIVDWLLNSQTAARIRDDYMQAGDSFRTIWSDPVALRSFMFDSPASIKARVNEYTNSDPDLVGFVRTGRLSNADGETLFTMDTKVSNVALREEIIANRAGVLGQRLRPYKDRLPEDMRLRMRVLRGRVTPKSMADTMFDWFFEWNGRKENAWAMGPEFSYAFNDAVAGLMRAMVRPDRQRAWEFIQGAERRFRPHSEVYIRAREAMKAPEGSLTMADVERVAARQASEHVKGLFYDARRRNMFFHQLRMVMPFAQPFADTLWRWGRLMAARPYMVEKLGRLAIGLSEPGSGVIYDDFDAIDPLSDRQTRDPTQGFIYTDQSTGEQMFSFPLIGSVLGAVLSPGFAGAEAQVLRAPVSGLNLAFQGDIDFLPSLGPLITIPLTQLMPDDAFGAIPEFIRDFAFPYGEPQLEHGLIESVGFPSWARRLMGTLISEDFRAYSYKGLLAYFVTTKEYPGLQGNQQVQQQLIDDVQGAARWMTLIRAIGAAVLPAAPSQEIYAADSDGSLIAVTHLADYWQHVLKESNYDFEAATKAFVDTYGEQALAATVPATEGEQIISGPGWEFLKENSPTAMAYADIIGLFFPGDYSYEAAQWQLERGERTRLSVEQREEKLLSFLYQAERAQIDARAAREEWDVDDVEAAKEQLDLKYGGVTPTFIGERTASSQLDKVRNALRDFEDLRETRGGEGAMLLFDAYDRWTAEADLRHGQSLSARASAQERQEFLDELDMISSEFGGGNNVPDGGVDTIARLFVTVVTPRE